MNRKKLREPHDMDILVVFTVKPNLNLKCNDIFIKKKTMIHSYSKITRQTYALCRLLVALEILTNHRS